jgi:hypothetical protein
MVVMVNIDFERFKVVPFLKKNSASATVLLSDGKVEDSYGVQGIPLTLVLDRKGMIRYRKMGFSAGGENDLIGALEALLSEGEKTATSR